MKAFNDKNSFVLWSVLAVVAVCLLPLLFDSRAALVVASQACTAAVFALSYNILLGQGGMMSFGHSLYYGLGGYFTIHVIAAAGEGWLPFPAILAPLAGGVFGGSIGVIFGFLNTRFSGVPFSMVSLGLGEMIGVSAWMFHFFFGGEQGVSADRTLAPALLGIDLGSRLAVYYVVLGWTIFSVLLIYGFSRSPLGKLLNAARDNPERVAFVGYDPARIRWLSFIVSAGFAGVAGGMTALTYEVMTANTISLELSGLVLLMAYIGGIGNFIGPIVGAIIITVARSSLSDYTEAWQLYLGLLFIFVVIFARDGLVGIAVRAWPMVRSGAWLKCLPVFTAITIAIVVLTLSLVALIELAYRRFSIFQHNTLHFLGFELAPDNPTTWLVVFVLFALSTFLTAALQPRARAAALATRSSLVGGPTYGMN